MKIFVTGGNGFIGSWLVKALVEAGHEATLLLRPTSDLSLLNGISFTPAFGDITDYRSVLEGMTNCKLVFHTAAHIAYSPQAKALMNKVNVQGTENVLRASIENKIKRLVHTSSIAAIGASEEPEILNEDSPYEIGHLNLGYNETKREAEELVKNAVRSGKLDAVIVNPSLVYGPGDAKKNSRKLHLKVAQGRIPFYPIGGINVVSIEDVIEGHLKALEKGRSGERYILGGENLTFKNLFGLLAKSANHFPPKIPVPKLLLNSISNTDRFFRRFGVELGLNSESLVLSSLYSWFDNSKSRIELGINFKSAEYAVSQSIKWCLENKLI